MIQYWGNFSTRAPHLISVGTDGVNMPFATGAAGGGVITCLGSTGSLLSADSDVSGQLNKVAIRYDGTGSAICVNGGAVTTSSTTKYQGTNPTALSHAGQLNRGAGDKPTNGYESRWTGWNKALTNGEMILLTSASTP